MTMKNIQFIDGALNCMYAVYAVTDDEFQFLFPDKGQDVEFVEDILDRSSDKKLSEVLALVLSRRVQKPNVTGIHGTVFYQLSWKKMFYPTKRADQMVFGRVPNLKAIVKASDSLVFDVEWTDSRLLVKGLGRVYCLESPMQTIVCPI